LTGVVERIGALIDRAVCPSASPEEARTCAHIAVRLIREHRIRVGQEVALPSTTEPVVRTICSKYDGWCKVCGGPYYVGATVVWTKGRGAAHLPCSQRPAR
jgi:hypothetical protein